jgi:alkyl hydroperoxide reductase subunit F
MPDLVIIGAGPAGMTAAIYAARKQLDVLVISLDVGGQTILSSAVENYLGYIYMSGVELVQKFEEHLKQFNLKVEYDTVSSLARTDNQFEVRTEGGKTYQAKAVIIASGKSSKELNIPGEKRFIGRGVTYCATCDAPLFRNMDVAVIGGGNSGLDATIQLTKIASKIYLIEYNPALKADEVFQTQARAAPNVEILTNTQTMEIKGDEMVKAIVVKNRGTGQIREIPVKGVFIEIGLKPNVGFVPKELELNQWDEIKVDHGCRTNIPGLFAAGDVTDVPEKQIIIAAGEGSKAALSAYDYLLRQGFITAGPPEAYT